MRGMITGLGLALAASSAPAAADAARVSVGDVAIAVPAPAGFAEITTKMTTLHALSRRMVAPDNIEFAAFIPREDVDAALADTLAALPRRFSLQAGRHLVGPRVAQPDFQRLKRALRESAVALGSRAVAALSEPMRDLADDLAAESGSRFSMAVRDIETLPVHHEDAHSLSYSMRVHHDMTDARGNPAPFVSVATATLVHVRGKVLFLYAFGEASDLDWSRRAAADWASALLAANPAPPPAGAGQDPRVQRAPLKRGMPWLDAAMLAMLGLGVLLFRSILRRS